MSEPGTLKEESVTYLSGTDKLKQAKDKIASMTSQERWAFYETDEFAGALAEHFHQAKVEALTDDGSFYSQR